MSEHIHDHDHDPHPPIEDAEPHGHYEVLADAALGLTCSRIDI